MELNFKFGKPLAGGGVVFGPTFFNDTTGTIFSPSKGTYNAHGFYMMENNPPEPREGYVAVKCHYEVRDNKCVTVWEYEKIRRTEADFNAALENHLREERTARGYDTREPSDYFGSSVGRWRQDALDWIAHRDRVMEYGLAILNEWKRTGIEPDYDEFVANLPRIIWTEA